MRRSCALLIGISLLPSGCWLSPHGPDIVALGGGPLVRLSNRDQVHEAFGSPLAAGTTDGGQFEDFLIRNGCDRICWGERVPAFQPLWEEFHIRDWGELQLVTVGKVASIPESGKNLIIVAIDSDKLHFRMFDEEGTRVVDTDETKLPEQAAPIAELKKYLEILWPPHKLSEPEKLRVIRETVAIVGKIPLGSFELGMTKVFCHGTHKEKCVPSDSDRYRVFPGQILRFEFSKAGEVQRVYVNGKLLLPISEIPPSAEIPDENKHP
jgi:hypothetical protein